MSRAGKPTDNPVNEALNGWIKEELYVDFKLETLRDLSSIKEAISNYIDYYNNRRPCFAIGYDTPVNYRKRFFKGEMPRKDTFSTRQLSEIPKFALKRIKDAENQKVTGWSPLSETVHSKKS